MRTVTLTESELNAVRAALDERCDKLNRNCLVAQRRRAREGHVPSEDEERAYVWNVAALHETEQARETLSETSVAPETESEKAAAWGR